MTFVLKITISK